MKSLTQFALNKAYERVEKLGDKLIDANNVIDWQKFKPIVADMYDNQSPKGGRPNFDEILMVKLLVLQAWHGLSDPELERQVSDRISFMKFLGFPETIPDYSTVWYFRERLMKTGKDHEIWDELQRQLEENNMKVKEGVMQDATFITADPGHAPVDKPRGPTAKTRRNKDAAWTKKGGKSYFGYKLHIKTDIDYGLIRVVKTTPANVHDSQIDLSLQGEVVYRDRGYFGTHCKGYNATMDRGVRGRKINARQKLRNKRISRKRTPWERPFAVIKNIFHSGHQLVTTNLRIHTKNIFSCFSYNLTQLITLQKNNP